MPIYEFECSEGHRFSEYFKSPKSEATAKCECGRRAKKVMSTFHFDFPNLPKMMDGVHCKRIQQKREVLAERLAKRGEA